jgi:2-dehydro-3-deoxyphosphogluconate aldolase/(4S)-4-hydroxy-2-oxoglutarate aldolase
MRFCPTGGVNLKNVNDFLSLSNVVCVGGSWIVPKAAMDKKDFHEITRLCKEAVDIIKLKKVVA